ncbi:MAG: NUDIX hydrolase [Sporocytophaga sp.]|nr:NUDIX hydrolase [Sporocytophaga sp.]
MIEKWKTLASEIVFNHKWYKLRKDLVQLPDGKIVDDYFVSVRPEVVVIFAITKNKKVVLVKQYKHGSGEILIELPGGIYDPETESPEEAALRELKEETGYSGKVVKIAELIDNPTKDTNKIHLYGVKNAIKSGEQNLDDTEAIEVLLVSIEELKTMLLQGEIKVSGSVAGSMLALQKLNID